MMALKLWLIFPLMIAHGTSKNSNSTTNATITQTEQQVKDLPKTPNVTNATKESTPKDIKTTIDKIEVDWSISHELYSTIDPHNESISHYSVTFHSFNCKKTQCNCTYLDMQINIDSIHRPMKPIACDKKLEFDILPGIKYEFEITPNVLFNDTKHVITQSKTFPILNKEIPADTVSFELQLQLDNEYYSSLKMNTKELSTKLIQELSELSKMNRHQISFAVTPSSALFAVTMCFMFPMEHSTQSQLAIEQARNLLYDPDPTLLSTIMQNSVHIQPIAVREIISATTQPVDVSNTKRFNYGFVFICAVVLCVSVFLMSKYAPYTFQRLTDLCELILDVIKQNCEYLMEKVSNISDIRTSRETYRYDHDILNISADLAIEMEEEVESGIVLLDEVLQQENVDLFTRERYIQTMRDNWLTTVGQLKQLNKQDWKRFGIPENIRNVMLAKLLDPEDPVSEDISRELSFRSCNTRESDGKDVDPELINATAISDTDFSDF